MTFFPIIKSNNQGGKRLASRHTKPPDCILFQTACSCNSRGWHNTLSRQCYMLSKAQANVALLCSQSPWFPGCNTGPSLRFTHPVTDPYTGMFLRGWKKSGNLVDTHTSALMTIIYIIKKSHINIQIDPFDNFV